MAKGCGCVIGITVILVVTVAIVKYSLPILLGVGIAGAVSGAGVALYNFYQVLIEAHKTILE
jgi:hypothetical protein